MKYKTILSVLLLGFFFNIQVGLADGIVVTKATEFEADGPRSILEWVKPYCAELSTKCDVTESDSYRNLLDLEWNCEYTINGERKTFGPFYAEIRRPTTIICCPSKETATKLVKENRTGEITGKCP